MPEFDPHCVACPRLASHLSNVRDMYPTYYARPVPPFGDAKARLIVVGLAPGMHGANRSGRPFTGDHAGILLYETLHRHGFADRPVSKHARDGLQAEKLPHHQRRQMPAAGQQAAAGGNRHLQSLSPDRTHETRAGHACCSRSARSRTTPRSRRSSSKRKEYKFAHGALHKLPNGLHLLDSYHCSRYNTQTKRLTAEMFDKILHKAKGLLAG